MAAASLEPFCKGLFLSFLHSHNAPFGKSDVCFICILRPLGTDIVMQESEIAAAQWMPIKEFVAQPKYQENELMKKICDVCIASSEKRYKGFQTSSNSAKHQSVFYYNVVAMN
eukprot:Gb_03708 [translate_table: standard]